MQLRHRRLLLALVSAPLALGTLLVAAQAPATVPATSPAGVHSSSRVASPLTELRFLSGHGPEDAVLWDFQCTAGARSGEWAKIRVPSCWEQEGFGTYNYGMSVRDKPDDFPGLAREQGRYRLHFQVPSEWRGRAVRIVFDGVMTDAEVTLNGKSAGPVHQGAFYRFRHDVSALLDYSGDNLLEVLVSKESSNRSVNEAERRGDYWNFGGIFRPVFLEALPPAHLSRIAVDARADGSLTCDVFPGGSLPTAATLSAELLDAKGAVVARVPASALSPSQGRQRITAKVDGIRPWTAETPSLYTLRVSLVDASGAALHTVSERIGFRTFEVRPGEGLYLNGQRIVLKGVNRHPFRPATGRTLSAADDRADVALIRGMNMNALRVVHYPPDKTLLDACDEQGLYVLNELGGWHGIYETSVGRSLVGEMVSRDVNHASILFWDNGNETGWNPSLDSEFARWDPQARPVLHPLGVFSGLNTFHYRNYAETQGYLAGQDLFMPTEFLHGLYDGGHGSGLHDYWELMRSHPRSGGGFLWSFADEGLSRSDQEGRIDNAGSFAPDGIVGPNHEKKGSYETIREVWSPVFMGPEALPENFDGAVYLENRYDFTPLDACAFRWSLVRFASIDSSSVGHSALASGELRGPSIAPHASGTLRLPLPSDWRSADALLLTAVDPSGRDLWTRSWSWATVGVPSTRASSSLILPDAPLSATLSAPPVGAAARSAQKSVEMRDDGVLFSAQIGGLELRWDKDSGDLDNVLVDGRPISLRKGPRLVAAHRSDRRLDGSPVPGPLATGTDRQYTSCAPEARRKSITQRREGTSVVTEVGYEGGGLRSATWRLDPDGTLYLDYEYSLEGVVDLVGIAFSYPEARMRSVRWLGMGPYRVWQNRLHGTTLDVWSNGYNDSVPGSTYALPEFKGYFRGWQWASFTTSEGRISLFNRAPASFLGVYTPRDGAVEPHLCVLPEHGLGVFDVIPAMRNKVSASELVGPSSQPQRVSGVHRGSVAFRFTAD